MTSLFPDNISTIDNGNSLITKQDKTLLIESDKKKTNRYDSFQNLGLSDWICRVTSHMGFMRPFDVQLACIPAILNGSDVIGIAQTG